MKSGTCFPQLFLHPFLLSSNSMTHQDWLYSWQKQPWQAECVERGGVEQHSFRCCKNIPICNYSQISYSHASELQIGHLCLYDKSRTNGPGYSISRAKVNNWEKGRSEGGSDEGYNDNANHAAEWLKQTVKSLMRTDRKGAMNEGEEEQRQRIAI